MTGFALIALLLPGLAWWAWLGKRDQDPLLSLGQICGISIALILLLAEAVFLTGGRFSIWGISLLLALCILMTAAGFLKKGIHLQKKGWRRLLYGLGLLSLATTWRLYQARNLLLPNWVDSQHHYLIIQVFMENGGIPRTLAPYLDQPFYYHYGYHALTALFTTISSMEIGEAMLLLGQILNALIGLSVYALGMALWEDWRPAAFAALLVSFVTRMPAYYLTWGRYTLTTSMVLLPLALGLTRSILAKNHKSADCLSLGIMTAGVILSHYFAAALLAFFMLIAGTAHLLRHLRSFRCALKNLSRLMIAGASGLLLAAPWLIRVAQYMSLGIDVKVNLPESVGALLASQNDSYIWQLLGPMSNYWLLLTALIGLSAAIIKRKSLSFGVWSLSLGMLALPWSLAIKPFRPDHFAIVLFLPIALWVAWLFWKISSWIGARTNRKWISLVFLGCLVGGWISWGIIETANVINPVTVLVSEEDLHALGWVKEHTNPEARFFMNTTYWINNTYRGVDGGGWLLPLTGRWSLVPTVFYTFSPFPEQRLGLRAWGEDASRINSCTDEFWDLVRTANLDHIYLKSGVGSLQPEGLTGCSGIQRVFQNNSIQIYRITQD